MNSFDLFGINASNLGMAKELVEKLLRGTLHAHESGYRAGAYWRYEPPGGGSYILRVNYDAIENEWSEKDFKLYPFLLYVSKVSDQDSVKDQLSSGGDSVVHLRRTVLP